MFNNTHLYMLLYVVPGICVPTVRNALTDVQQYEVEH